MPEPASDPPCGRLMTALSDDHPVAWDVIATVSGGDQLTVLLATEIDIASAPALHSRLYALITRRTARNVTLDLADVEFCDAAGARVLVRLAQLVAEQGGQLRLRGARPHIAWLIRFLGHAELLD